MALAGCGCLQPQRSREPIGRRCTKPSVLTPDQRDVFAKTLLIQFDQAGGDDRILRLGLPSKTAAVAGKSSRRPSE